MSFGITFSGTDESGSPESLAYIDGRTFIKESGIFASLARQAKETRYPGIAWIRLLLKTLRLSMYSAARERNPIQVNTMSHQTNKQLQALTQSASLLSKRQNALRDLAKYHPNAGYKEIAIEENSFIQMVLETLNAAVSNNWGIQCWVCLRHRSRKR